jgi:ribosomal protein S14
MTIAQAEKICGYRIERLSKIRTEVPKFAAYDDDGAELLRVESKLGERVALKMLIEGLYQREGDYVFERQKWRCLDCGRHTALFRHHVIPRSRGRVDRGNLVGLCWPCHEARHRTNHL